MIFDKCYEKFHNIININNILTVMHKMYVYTITKDMVNKFTYLQEYFYFALTFLEHPCENLFYQIIFQPHFKSTELTFHDESFDK